MAHDFCSAATSPRFLARLALLVGVLLAGCAAGCNPSETNRNVLELWAAGREGEVVAKLTPGFEAENPGWRVKVQQLPWTGAHEKLLTAVVGDSVPDVAQLGNTWIPEFATIGALDALDEAVARSSVIAEQNYFSGVWDTNQVAGKLYGVPWYVDTRLLFYRRDLLAQAGFSEPPRDWAQWLSALSAIQARSSEGKSAMFLPLNEPEPLLALALQQPEPLLRDGDRFGNFRSAGFRRALSFYVELFRRGLAPKAGSAQIGNVWDEFARGTFVFYVSGPWQLGEFRRRLPAALSDSWSTAPLPGREGPGASLAGGSSLVVFAGSQKKATAWKLIEYLSRPEIQKRFYELTGDLPARRDNWREPPLATDEQARAFREQLDRVEAMPKVPEWERIASAVATVGERAARSLLSVDAAVDELDARADHILEKRRWVLEKVEAR